MSVNPIVSWNGLATRRLAPSPAERFDRLRANRSVRAFLDGADPAAIAAIAGAASRSHSR